MITRAAYPKAKCVFPAGAGVAAARPPDRRPRHHHSAREHRGLLSGSQSRLGLWRFQADRGCRAVAAVIAAVACDRFAFDYAATADIDRLAVIHTRTALPQTEGLFIRRIRTAAPR